MSVGNETERGTPGPDSRPAETKMERESLGAHLEQRLKQQNRFSGRKTCCSRGPRHSATLGSTGKNEAFMQASKTQGKQCMR
jgi:hypothetical protein